MRLSVRTYVCMCVCACVCVCVCVCVYLDDYSQLNVIYSCYLFIWLSMIILVFHSVGISSELLIVYLLNVACVSAMCQWKAAIENDAERIRGDWGGVGAGARQALMVNHTDCMFNNPAYFISGSGPSALWTHVKLSLPRAPHCSGQINTRDISTLFNSAEPGRC